MLYKFIIIYKSPIRHFEPYLDIIVDRHYHEEHFMNEMRIIWVNRAQAVQLGSQITNAWNIDQKLQQDVWSGN